ncbi:thioesterase II family protein [Thalassospira alkalitolerans]|uniref:thioesterase II family protein n=1 Tax=Thalassospira alkalitolerans TaxID=1293890 RepID=UPI003AA8420C
MTKNVWVNNHVTAQARLRLFCFPFAGGGGLAYRPWLTQFPSDVDVIPVSLPGREQRFGDPVIDDLATMVAALANGLKNCLDRPFAFFGYSMGALIAHHLACHLQQSGQGVPIHLFVAARRGPTISGHRPPLHGLPSDAFWQGIAHYGGTPREILDNAEYRDMFEPSLRADFKLSETAISSGLPMLDCPITAFGGADDPNPVPIELDDWATATGGEFAKHILPGGHFFLRDAGDDIIYTVKNALLD